PRISFLAGEFRRSAPAASKPRALPEMTLCKRLPGTGVADAPWPGTYRATTAVRDVRSEIGRSTRLVLPGWRSFRRPAARPEAPPDRPGLPCLGRHRDVAPEGRDFPARRGQMLPSAPHRSAAPSI